MGSEVAAKTTPCTPQQLVDALVAVWPAELGGSPSLEQVCILAAQWALETAHGASMVCWNIGNVKCPDPNAGDYCCFTTIEYVAGKPITIHPPDPGCRFRAFPSLEAGAQFYLHGMWSHWTKAWPFVAQGDPDGFAQGLHDQSYYTAPPAQYAAAMRRYFDLYMRTLKVPASAPTDPPPMGDPVP